MKAAIYRNKEDIEIQEVKKPEIQDSTDAIVKINYTTICGTDIHIYHGLEPSFGNNTPGHEFVGVVESVGSDVKTVRPGDRVVGTSTIACGGCFYCKMGLYGMCDNTNPYREKSGAYFGSPRRAGGYPGSQAEYLRAPFADMVLYKIPDGITDEQALIMSDIFPTGYFGAEMAEIKPGESVVVYGAGPVGQMAALSAKIMGAARIFIVDEVDYRLEMAEQHIGAITINPLSLDPVEKIMQYTDGYGVDKAIEAVGLEAHSSFLETVAETLNLEQSSGVTVRNAIKSVRKGGVVSIVGSFSGSINDFPIGDITGKNITMRGGICNHRKYMDTLANIIKSGVDPTYVLTHRFSLDDISEAYRLFDKDKDRCVKELITVF